MNYCQKATIGLPKMQDQKSLRLHGHSFLGWARECAAVIFDTKGG
jgi:hypothetical protein